MAKRFTDTEKWKKPFIRTLQAPCKLLWLYILDECDHAGIWQVDFDVARIKIGEEIDEATAVKELQDKIKVFRNGEKWFIPDFIEFQYGQLNPENRAHNSVIQILNKYNLLSENKGHTSPLNGAMDMDKDKELDKVKVKGAISKTTGSALSHKATLLLETLFFEKVAIAWNINKYQYEKMIDAFEGMLASEEKAHLDFLEYKKHFHNWGAKKHGDFQQVTEAKIVKGQKRKSANEFI